MTTIYFVRHNQPQKDHIGEDALRPLTEEGLKDRQYVLDLLKDERIDLIYCSTYKRSIQTIELLAKYKQLMIHLDERFKERVNGIGEINPDSIYQRWQDLNYHETGGESLAMLEKRNIEALHELLMKYPDHHIVIGTHGSALSTIIHYYDASFNYDSFMRIMKWTPYIVKMEFDGIQLRTMKELGYIDYGKEGK